MDVAELAPAALAAALDRHEATDLPALPGRRNHRRAGVLVPLRFGGDATLLLTERAAALRDHAGEVSFPGGKPEPADGGDLSRTALREAREELGIAGARLLGQLSSMPLFTSDYRLVPFVAQVGPAPLVPSPGEVARVLPLRLAAVFSAPALDCMAWPWQGGLHHSLVLRLDGAGGLAAGGTGPVVYGATAETLLELLRVVAAAVPGLALPPWRVSWRWDGAARRPVPRSA